jgi:hypothetical protein
MCLSTIGYFSANSQAKSERKDSLVVLVAPDAASGGARAHADEEPLEYLAPALMFIRRLEVVTDVNVLRPVGVGAGGASAAVAAPTGGPVVGQAATADPAAQQPRG